MVEQIEVESLRPSGYQYLNELKKHLGGDLSAVFSGTLVYPRQLEIHLPGDGKRACNFNCYHCQGRLLKQPLGNWEAEALRLVYNLHGRIPYHIYGGAYTEPLLNPSLLAFLFATKYYGSNFGIHTNGSLFLQEEKQNHLLTFMCGIANSSNDYISISLDAGHYDSHCKSKRLKENWFDVIIRGIRKAVEIRGLRDYPSIRICYLINKHNSDKYELRHAVELMRQIGVDSLRFSIPYDLYGKEFKRVRKYKHDIEIAEDARVNELLDPLLSTDQRDRPYIFYIPPYCQDVDRMCFSQCIYSYYQITLAADGYVYKCSSTASPSFKVNRLGKITDNLDEFNRMVLANHNPDFDASTCFNIGARCNRIALEINTEWQSLND